MANTHPMNSTHGGGLFGALGLNVGATPAQTDYPGADMLKVDLVQIDTNNVPKDLHANPMFAQKLTQNILHSITRAGEWYISDDGLGIVHWDSLGFKFLKYDFPVATIAENPENGAIPLVERSVRKFGGDVERFAIGAKFSISELQNMDAKDQGVNIITLVCKQLRACALETLGSMVMRTFVRVENAIRRQGILENHYAAWTIEDFYEYQKITYAAASRGEGGFRIMLGQVEDERQKLHMHRLDHLAVHQTTRASLVQDNREHFIGGDRGVARFEAGNTAMTNFAGYALNVADTFRRVDRTRPENVLERRGHNGEFYLSAAPGEENTPHDEHWAGFYIYDEQRDAKHFLRKEDLIDNLCWWDAEGNPDGPTLSRIYDGFDAGDPMYTRRPYAFRRYTGDNISTTAAGFDIEPAPHPYFMISYDAHAGIKRIHRAMNLSDYVAALGDLQSHNAATVDTAKSTLWNPAVPDAVELQHVSKYWIHKPDNVDATAQRQRNHVESRNTTASAAMTALGLDVQERVRAGFSATGATRFVRVDGPAANHAADPYRAAHAEGSGEFEFDDSAHKMHGVVASLDAGGLQPAAFFTKGTEGGVYVAAVAEVGEARALATNHGFTEIPVGVDPALVRHVAVPESGTISAARGGAAAAATTKSRGAATQLDAAHATSLGTTKVARAVAGLVRSVGTVLPDRTFAVDARGAVIYLTRTGLRDLVRRRGVPFPFHFMVIRDNITRDMASCVAYGKDPGAVMLSQMKSMSAGNSSDMHGYVSYEFNAGAFIHTPEKVQILQDVGFLRYLGGKNCDFVDFSAESNELPSWQEDASSRRGDMVVHCIPLGASRGMQYCSLTGEFDTKGYPTPGVLPHNDGFFYGQPFVYDRLGLANVVASRTPENTYTIPPQINLNLALGTAWRAADGMPGAEMTSGACTLDGGDFVGAKALRLGREMSHARLNSMRHGV
jgi:hypothetical protein